MIALSQAATPVVPVGSLDDSAWIVGDPSFAVSAFLAQVSASRASGVLCRGRVYLSADVAATIFGAAAISDLGPWSSPMLLHTHNASDAHIELFADITVPPGSALLE